MRCHHWKLASELISELVNQWIIGIEKTHRIVLSTSHPSMIAAPPAAPRPAGISPKKMKFVALIRNIVAELESSEAKIHSIPNLYHRHQMKRRRLYDVTNVFTAIGCAVRSGTDDIEWQGVSKILPHLLEAKQERQIINCEVRLSDLFPPDNCVGLISLTTSFIMLFPALSTDVLNMRDASTFFSRDTPRYKTTLSKLYQITLILGALEMTQRTENPTEIRLKPPYTQLLSVEGMDNPLAIEKLLNGPSRWQEALEARREEFRTICGASAAA
jgi:hypothetical protein